MKGRIGGALRIARAILLVSIALYAIAWLLGEQDIGPIAVWFWLSLAGMMLMVASALACLILQLALVFRRRA